MLDLSKKQLADDGLKQWFETEAPVQLEKLGKGPLNVINVSCNLLTDEGVEFLVNVFLERKQPTRRLKLFQNLLREPSAICTLIEDPYIGAGLPNGLTEIGLSHNNISAVALGRILDSLRKRAVLCGGLWPPFWLRVECNDALNDFAHDIAELHRTRGLKLCLQCGIPKSGCNIRKCIRGADVHLRLEDPLDGANAKPKISSEGKARTSGRTPPPPPPPRRGPKQECADVTTPSPAEQKGPAPGDQGPVPADPVPAEEAPKDSTQAQVNPLGVTPPTSPVELPPEAKPAPPTAVTLAILPPPPAPLAHGPARAELVGTGLAATLAATLAASGRNRSASSRGCEATVNETAAHKALQYEAATHEAPELEATMR